MVYKSTPLRGTMAGLQLSVPMFPRSYFKSEPIFMKDDAKYYQNRPVNGAAENLPFLKEMQYDLYTSTKIHVNIQTSVQINCKLEVIAETLRSLCPLAITHFYETT